MTYFHQNTDNISLFNSGNKSGLRKSQTGALFGVISHFTIHSENALVSMPTGSGKTAVLMLLPFLLKAKRVLVLTSSRMVRGQIAEDFSTLRTLKSIQVIPPDLESPKVVELKHTIKNEDEWKVLQDSDVIISIPYAISSYFDSISNKDSVISAFDLILVDEAHHSAARTWKSILDVFSGSKIVLFTATPFRRDKKEIPGKVVYNYPISYAHKDGIFGDIQFVPVNTDDIENQDIQVAKRTEETFTEDKANGFQHHVMVRTDSVKRAKHLASIYSENTTLRLAQIDSNHTYKHARTILDKLKTNDLDGIICVDMLGEGFDFPTLKIAAIHTPHKSLAVTLQFIGRFARTNSNDLGTAKFIAIPSEIEIESEKLFSEGAIWQKVVHNLSETTISNEIKVKETLGTFELRENKSDETDDLSLYSLIPFTHVKIFSCIIHDLDQSINFPTSFNVIHRQFSEEFNTLVIITMQKQKPEWSKSDQFTSTAYDLFVIFYDTAASLLFICASRRIDSIYKEIAKQLSETPPRPLSLEKINKVLLDLKEPQFFNVGMRNRSSANSAESYKIIAGSKAEKGIDPSEARFYHRGHIFGRARENDNFITIGVSSGSKVWSNSSVSIPELIFWCQKNAKKILSKARPVTGSELDLLQTGEEITKLPSDEIMLAEWDPEVFLHNLELCYEDNKGNSFCEPLSNFSILIDYEKTNSDKVYLVITNGSYSCSIEFSLINDGYLFKFGDSNEPNVKFREDDILTISSYLMMNPPTIYLSNLSSLIGNQYFEFLREKLALYNKNYIEDIQWDKEMVDITLEVGSGSGGLISVQDYIRNYLTNSNADIVFFDHRTGEMADFITIDKDDDNRTVNIKFYHCKASGGKKAGRRVDDVYEVCGQAVKCLVWVHRNEILEKNIKRRYVGGSQFLKGSQKDLSNIINDFKSFRTTYQVVIVQPGISKSKANESILHLLENVNDYLTGFKCEPLLVFGSK